MFLTLFSFILSFYSAFNWCCLSSSFYVVKHCFIAEVVVSPPFVFLPLVKSLLRSDFQVAAQNCWIRRGGAFTGEIRYVFILFL